MVRLLRLTAEGLRTHSGALLHSDTDEKVALLVSLRCAAPISSSTTLPFRPLARPKKPRPRRSRARAAAAALLLPPLLLPHEEEKEEEEEEEERTARMASYENDFSRDDSPAPLQDSDDDLPATPAAAPAPAAAAAATPSARGDKFRFTQARPRLEQSAHEKKTSIEQDKQGELGEDAKAEDNQDLAMLGADDNDGEDQDVPGAAATPGAVAQTGTQAQGTQAQGT
ncbi:uncharacterized protein MYCGRDRAFT_93854 [Zymoseptoria tritici IPO323]|uniref:Uncharacterized protein n=1 Tax=Zymoseptoria tritici (strain CBS 115943 / IPO323) TaxID=336722 RepID=F9XD90_ZYMTI|nr:uncharacterized protein MYCGRDRAFT_93854 [Zymoseptoria tritici IPO323]EGP86447.1 hypothetical protein MYCGRDRAFT_93854 [Zymoseptoria tritici IPO323]